MFSLFSKHFENTSTSTVLKADIASRITCYNNNKKETKEKLWEASFQHDGLSTTTIREYVNIYVQDVH